MKATWSVGVGLACSAALAIGCGGSDGSSASRSASGESAKPSIELMATLGGPLKDGGYNEGAMIPSTQAAAEAFPGKVTVTHTAETTYDERATKILQQSIANGTNMYFDSQGLTTLVSDVCKKNPNVKCLLAGDSAQQAPNTRTWLPADWNLNFLAGVASGLMTKTGQIGIVLSYNVPVTKTVINTYALGCQSVRPDCKVRAVFIDNYFDPPKAAQAAETLIDVGADVIRNYVDDPAFCQVAEKRGVLAVGEFADFSAACPKAQIMATVWSLHDYIVAQAKQILDGTWKGGGRDIIEVGIKETTPHIGGWGDFVPADVRQKVEALRDEIVAGKDVVVGPIYDTKGKLRFKDGEVPSVEFLSYDWTWFVRGVVAGS